MSVSIGLIGGLILPSLPTACLLRTTIDLVRALDRLTSLIATFCRWARLRLILVALSARRAGRPVIGLLVLLTVDRIRLVLILVGVWRLVRSPLSRAPLPLGLAIG